MEKAPLLRSYMGASVCVCLCVRVAFLLTLSRRCCTKIVCTVVSKEWLRFTICQVRGKLCLFTKFAKVETKKKWNTVPRVPPAHHKAKSIAIFSTLDSKKWTCFWWHATNFNNVIQLQQCWWSDFFPSKLFVCWLYIWNTNSAKSRLLKKEKYEG